jgi:superfamily II RNA helicase
LAGRTKKKKVYLLSTQHRPVPLQHYLFYDDDMYPLLVENKFNENAISDATKRSKEKAAV